MFSRQEDKLGKHENMSPAWHWPKYAICQDLSVRPEASKIVLREKMTQKYGFRNTQTKLNLAVSLKYITWEMSVEKFTISPGNVIKVGIATIFCCAGKVAKFSPQVKV